MNRLNVSITVVRQGHWQGRRYICESASHPGNVTIGENEDGPNTVVRKVKCDRGGWRRHPLISWYFWLVENVYECQWIRVSPTITVHYA